MPIWTGSTATRRGFRPTSATCSRRSFRAGCGALHASHQFAGVQRSAPCILRVRKIHGLCPDPPARHCPDGTGAGGDGGSVVGPDGFARGPDRRFSPPPSRSRLSATCWMCPLDERGPLRDWSLAILGRAGTCAGAGCAGAGEFWPCRSSPPIWKGLSRDGAQRRAIRRWMC